MFVYKNKHLSSGFFFFSFFSFVLVACRGRGERRSQSQSAHIYSNTSMQKVNEPLHIRRPKPTGRGRKTKEQISQHLVTEHNKRLCFQHHGVFLLFDLIFLSLNIQKVHSPTSTKYLKNSF